MRRFEDVNEIPNMTVREYMELSLLAYFNGQELHRETPILYKGAWWNLHMCVSFVALGEKINNLEREQ